MSTAYRTSLSLFVASSAKKLIVFVIPFAKNGLVLEPVSLCLPTRGQSHVFFLLQQLFCSLLYISVMVPSNLRAECNPLQPGIRLEDADK